MAIDTQTKRRNALSVSPGSLVPPLADGTISLIDRGHISFAYGVNVVQDVPITERKNTRFQDERYRRVNSERYRRVYDNN